MFAALLMSLTVLFSCDRNKTPKTDENTKKDTIAEVPVPVQNVIDDDNGIAFKVFENIPKKDLNENFRNNVYRCPENSKRHFSIDNQGTKCEVQCFKRDEGGWLAVMVTETCAEDCNQEVHLYNYENDLLTFAADLLPHPNDRTLARAALEALGDVSEEDMENMDDEEVEFLVSNMVVHELYYFHGDEDLSVIVEGRDTDGMTIFKLDEELYKWNGKGFKKSK